MQQSCSPEAGACTDSLQEFARIVKDIESALSIVRHHSFDYHIIILSRFQQAGLLMETRLGAGETMKVLLRDHQLLQQNFRNSSLLLSRLSKT